MKQIPTVGARTAEEVLNFLPPDLIEVLAGLYGTSRAQADATIQLLPFGSRAALECMDPPLAMPGPAVEGSEYRTLELTDFGFEVIAEARFMTPNRPHVVTDWTSRADELKRMVAELRAT